MAREELLKEGDHFLQDSDYKGTKTSSKTDIKDINQLNNPTVGGSDAG